VLRFSRVNTRPARSPSSASRVRVRAAWSHIAGVTTSEARTGRPHVVEAGAVDVEARAVELLGDL
jgi:hypothetical protein